LEGIIDAFKEHVGDYSFRLIESLMGIFRMYRGGSEE
jgi:hypothetical protein